MDWANEKYVRLFVRDTITWKLLSWQSRALLPLILRKLDRSGVLDIGEYGEDGIAIAIDVPVDFVRAGMPDLLKHRVFTMADGRLVMPKYIPAQETRQSDKQRQRDSRERRARGEEQSEQAEQPVTGGDTSSPDVTSCHQESPTVTPTPIRSEPSPSQNSPSAPARDPVTPEPLPRVRPRTARDLTTLMRAAVEKHQPQAGMWNPGGSFAAQDARVFLEGFSDLEAALEEIERRVVLFAKDPAMAPWTLKKFAQQYNAIGQPKQPARASPRQGGSGIPENWDQKAPWE